MTDPEHLEDVLHPLPSAGERKGGLVGEDKLRASDVQVPDVDRDVLGFDEWRFAARMSKPWNSFMNVS